VYITKITALKKLFIRICRCFLVKRFDFFSLVIFPDNGYLGAGRWRDRIPVGARFSAPVQTGPGVHPAFYTMGTGSLTGVKRPGRGVDHPPPSNNEVKERVELYLYSPFGPS